MTNLQKQLLYDRYIRGEIEVKDITSGDLKAMKTHWFDHKYKELPLFEDTVKFDNELRRREVEAVSKPRKGYDRNFFERK